MIILKVYEEGWEKQCVAYLEADIDGKATIIKTKKIIANIIEYIKKWFDLVYESNKSKEKTLIKVKNFIGT